NYRSDPLGHQGLRQSLCAYLNRSRGMKCSPEQIVIFNGTQSAFDFICRLLINPGNTAIVENPGFPGARRTLLANAAELYAIDVDENGMRSEDLAEAPEDSRLLYLSPTHHDPLGVNMSQARKLQLLQWARSRNAIIVEDGFDTEFRYGDKPVSCLQSLDENGLVIYLSSFWRVLYPMLRIGYAVFPKRLLGLVSRAKSLLERDFQSIEHEALSLFIEEGHLERHIRKTRALYAKRRETLLAQVYKHLAPKARISACNSGMHLVASFPGFDFEQVLEAAAKSKLPLASSEDFYYHKVRESEFLIPFAHLDECKIAELVERFAAELTRL
ncbi:MAG: PLP-dependent aminotransferase family protein, partial [Candidatus Obscuribacterales bacterium]|nr:PLP-dependent aminotransferase family protein [Candidatus Obscuribacterales bacterium]